MAPASYVCSILSMEIAASWQQFSPGEMEFWADQASGGAGNNYVPGKAAEKISEKSGEVLSSYS